MSGPTTGWCSTMADPPRMNDRQFRRARRLIRRLCANYDRGSCLLLDDGYDPCICPQLISHTLLCRYFRAAVLPDDRELRAELLRERHVKSCRICGVPVVSGSNATKYCPACAKLERRRRDRERKQNRSRTSANRKPETFAQQGLQNAGPEPDEDLSPEDQNRL